MDDRETWDRATWDRYLAAASEHEPDYMPRIRRLLGEITNIDKLLALTRPRPLSVSTPARSRRGLFGRLLG